jgi:hypothetical protein
LILSAAVNVTIRHVITLSVTSPNQNIDKQAGVSLQRCRQSLKPMPLPWKIRWDTAAAFSPPGRAQIMVSVGAGGRVVTVREVVVVVVVGVVTYCGFSG